jgi:long-chain acyl-CoA synthetase
VIAGRTLCDELRHVAETCGDADAYSDEAGTGDSWRSLTWSQARQRVLEVAAGFAALGLAPGERVALMLPNRSEHVLADLASVHAGGLGATLYATLAPEQIGYVAAGCDARIAVLDGAAELARWQPVLDQLPGLTTIIVRDPAACPAGDRYMTWDGTLCVHTKAGQEMGRGLLQGWENGAKVNHELDTADHSYRDQLLDICRASEADLQ